MRVSLNWIKDYIPGLEINSEDDLKSLSDKMISAGLDIEKTEIEKEKYKLFIVAEVIEKKAHPDADKLSICKVNTGKQILNIVCGAPNVEVGQKICLAMIGAKIPVGGFEIKKTKIRGEISEGMICSEKELNLSDKHEGIMILDKNALTGQDFAEYIKSDDIIFEIGITPNRGDLFSHIGIAREIAACYSKKIILPDIKFTESESNTSELINIRIENTELCRRFTGRVIRNVTVKESPEWLKARLTAAGLRPRNNIVDVTNFVMLETGQPLHSFDYDKIRGKEISVKTASDGDKFTTLDSKERKLNGDSLMICDNSGYTGIAGIMGGEFSEISEKTANVFLESAYFDPVSVRKNSKRLGLQTDASQRFERGVDINMVEFASLRAAQLIQSVSGGEISRGLYDVYPEKFEPVYAKMNVKKVNELIGTDLKEEEIISLLSKIEINFVKKEEEKLVFEIPEFRRLDILKEADLAEETARLFGYDNIETKRSFNINIVSFDKESERLQKINKIISDHFIGRGFNQIMTYVLADGKKLNIFKNIPVKLINSVSEDMNSLRTNLIYGLAGVIRDNYNNTGKDISQKLFETGKVFCDEGNRFNEENRLIFGVSGKKDTDYIYGGDKEFNIFDIKGEAEMFLSKLNLENYRLIYYNDEVFHGDKIDISLNNEIIGNINKADSVLLKQFDLQKDLYYTEIYLDKIYKYFSFSRYYKPVSKFPSVKRDLAIVVDSRENYSNIVFNIQKSGGKILKNIELFDIYRDAKLGNGKKSLAFSLEFVSSEKTLTDEEISAIMEKIIRNLEIGLKAELRKQIKSIQE